MVTPPAQLVPTTGQCCGHAEGRGQEVLSLVSGGLRACSRGHRAGLEPPAHNPGCCPASWGFGLHGGPWGRTCSSP